MSALRCLTVRQPWAQLIVEGHKDVENRTWPTTYRGPLVIHAGRRWDPRGSQMAIDALGDTDQGDRLVKRAHDRLGMVVGVATVTGCHHAEDEVRQVGARDWLGDAWSPCSQWSEEDVHHWTLADAIALDTPIEASGALGLWTPPQRVLDAVQEVLAA